jgi:hypothetical protein
MTECTNWGTLATTTILISVSIGALWTLKVNFIMTLELEYEATGRLLNNSMVTYSNTTDLFTFFTPFTTETAMQKLTEKPTTVTDYGKSALFLTL